MPGFGASQCCTHILVTGHRCGSPALRGQYLCYFHARLMGRVNGRIDGSETIAHLESEESIQFALMSLLSRTLTGSIDIARANFALKVLNLAVRNSRRARFNYNPDEMVRTLPNYSKQYLAEHPEHADPAQVAARKTAAAKGLATRRANQQAREAKKLERAALRAARKHQGAADASLPEASVSHTAQSSHLSALPHDPNSTDPSSDLCPNPDPAPPANTTSSCAHDARNTPHANPPTDAEELRDFHISFEGARRGNLDDFRNVLEAAGLFESEAKAQ